MSNENYRLLWGKAAKDEAGNLTYHPLAYHMLDVAAVADVWLAQDQNLRELLLRKSGLDESSISTLLPVACALHDIGKATVYFQNKIPEIAQVSELYHETAAKSSGFNHGSFGCHWIQDWREEEQAFQEWAKEFPFLQHEGFLEIWNVSSWHHGQAFTPTDYSDENGFYPKEGDSKPKGKNDVFDTITSLRNATLQYVTQSITLNASPNNFNFKKTDPSFLRMFAGFVSICDWIGSDTEFFKYNQQTGIAYWDIARQNAKHALEEISLIPKPISQIKSFERILEDGKNPRPVQKALEELQINKPSLVIVEAPTGEGKTESALFQFARNPGRGFYFGLPTQASANQISGRIEVFLKEKLETKERAILAHGNAWLVKAILESKGYENKSTFGETTAESELSDWFNSKKRTLLSRFGVGTVDQAMLSALNVKHGFVKLFGLSGKTLIIDEVHAYDSFMLPIIEHLLRWCGYLETSVVLLSATLPSPMKQRLISAYLENDTVLQEHSSYPLLTIATKEDQNVREIDSYQARKIETRKTECISYDFMSHEKDSIDEIIAKALSTIEKGGNLLWICNTVKKAQFVYGELKKRQSEDLEIRLFHSRFTKIDRLKIEKEIESLYGDESKSKARPIKSILVATQVAEQSLDIDFDFLISDIAPIDLILQRAGRIFRHERNNRNVNFIQPEILLLLPTELAKLKDFSGVYDKFTVIKTILALTQIEDHVIRLPIMYRSLVESVYSETIPVSETLRFNSYSIKIPNMKWKEFLKKKKDEMDDLDTKGRRGLIPLPSTTNPSDSALLSEEEESTWYAKTRDGEEKISLIILFSVDGKYKIGTSLLDETIPEKLPRHLAIAFAENTVEVGTKTFIKGVKQVGSLVSNYPLLQKWQMKIKKFTQFKTNKFVLLAKDSPTTLILGGDAYVIDYSSETGLKLEKRK